MIKLLRYQLQNAMVYGQNTYPIVQKNRSYNTGVSFLLKAVTAIPKDTYMTTSDFY